MLILRGEIEKRKRKQVEKDLNSLLTRWTWRGKTFPNAGEFIARMAPWINEKVKEEKEVKELLKRKGGQEFKWNYLRFCLLF